MKPLKQARRYARMFINSVGAEAGKSIEELAVAAELMDRSSDFRALLVSPVFSGQERKAALEGMRDSLGMSASTVSFLLFLAAKRASYGLRQVLDKAVAIYSESMGRVKATVFTPSLELGKGFDARIREALKGVTTREVDLEFAEDASLIGGVLIQVGSTMLDGSIKGQLRLLKDDLIKG